MYNSCDLLGYSAFTPFDGVTFVTNYIGLVPAFVCYVGYKLIRRSKVVPLLDVGKYLSQLLIVLGKANTLI